LEAAHRVDTIVFDKTGTLTEGTPSVGAIVAARGFDAAMVVDLAGSLEAGSEHPAGEAIAARARADGLGGRAIREFRAVAGLGVEGTLDVDGAERRVVIGTTALLAARGIDVGPTPPSV